MSAHQGTCHSYAIGPYESHIHGQKSPSMALLLYVVNEWAAGFTVWMASQWTGGPLSVTKDMRWDEKHTRRCLWGWSVRTHGPGLFWIMHLITDGNSILSDTQLQPPPLLRVSSSIWITCPNVRLMYISERAGVKVMICAQSSYCTVLFDLNATLEQPLGKKYYSIPF